MFGQLVFALIEVVISHFHALDVQVELFPGQQTLLADQIAELKITQLRVAQLVL